MAVEREGGVTPQPPSLTSRAVSTYSANLAVAALSFVNVIVSARTLGVAGRGDVAFLTAIATLSANFALFGISEANANFGGSRPEERPSLFTNSLLFAVGFGTLAIGCVAVLVVVFPDVGGDSVGWLRWIALGAIPVLILQAYLQLLAQAEYGFRITNIAWVVGPVTNVVANVALAVAGRITVASVVVTWVIGQTLGVLLLVWHLGSRRGGVGSVDLALARRSLSFGAKSHLGRVMMVGNYRLDQWILGAVSGSRQLGLYSVAVAWAETLFYLPTSLVMAQRPDLVRASGSDARRQAMAGFRAAFVLTATLGVGLIVLAPLFIVPVFGSEFRGAITDLRILTAGAFGIVALKVFSAVLTAQRQPLRGSAGVGVALIATIVLDVLLIPPFGDKGAAIASTIAYSIGGLAMAWIFVRVLGGTLRDLVPMRSDVDVIWSEGTRRLRRRKPGS